MPPKQAVWLTWSIEIGAREFQRACAKVKSLCMAGWSEGVLVNPSQDAYYPQGSVSCCTPSLLLESGDAWELERCDCVLSEDTNCSGLSTHRLLFGFEAWRCVSTLTWSAACHLSIVLQVSSKIAARTTNATHACRWQRLSWCDLQNSRPGVQEPAVDVSLRCETFANCSGHDRRPCAILCSRPFYTVLAPAALQVRFFCGQGDQDRGLCAHSARKVLQDVPVRQGSPH